MNLTSSLKLMPWWDMGLLLFVKGIIQEFKQQIDTHSNKFNHTKTQKKHCTLGKDDDQIEFLIVSQRFLHVIQELMHLSMNPCISPSLLLHKLNFSFNDVTLTEGPGGRRAHDWLTKRLGSLNFSGQPPIYVLRFLKGMPFSQRICSRTSQRAPANQKHPNNTLLVSMGQIKRPA